jgi:hypothetical protein
MTGGEKHYVFDHLVELVLNLSSSQPPSLSPEDGSRTNFRNVVLKTWKKSENKFTVCITPSSKEKFCYNAYG